MTCVFVLFYRLFEDEQQDLFKDLQSLPGNAALRKLNDLIKRARLAKVILIKLIMIKIQTVITYLCEI